MTGEEERRATERAVALQVENPERSSGRTSVVLDKPIYSQCGTNGPCRAESATRENAAFPITDLV